MALKSSPTIITLITIYFILQVWLTNQGCLIVTKEANKDIKQIHHRQPVLLTLNEGDHWLNNEDQLDSELDDLVEYYPVSTKVNSPKNNSPELIQPL